MGFTGRVATVRGWLLLPMVLYLGVAWLWHAAGIDRPTGDEPHYLLIAWSLVSEADVELRENYRTELRTRRFYPPGLPDAHVKAGPRGWFSIHGLGLALLLALPTGLAGAFGARLAMALCAGLIPLVVFGIARRLLGDDTLAVATGVSLGLGLPMLAGANQIYPDLVTGLVLLWAAGRLLARRDGEPSSLRGSLAFGLAAAFLPWLHLKNAAAAFVLAAGWLVARRKTRFESGKTGERIPLAALALSLALLAGYHVYAFGDLTGPYARGALRFEASSFAVVFLGLHWDQAQGLFLQQPLFLLGLPGVVPLARRDAGFVLLLGILYLSVLVPNALHPNWYGGHSFAGRFGSSAALLWTFPLCQTLAVLARAHRSVPLLLCGAAVVLQTVLAHAWLRPGFLYRRMNVPLDQYNSLYGDLRSFLPAFYDFDLSWAHAPNYAFVLLGLVLLASGFRWMDRRGEG